MPYIGRSTDGFGVRNRFVYLASSGATSVSGADANGATLTFTDGAYVDVYLNGVLLKPTTDYNTSTAGTIAGLSALNTNDEVTVVVYDVFTVADMVSATSGGTFSGNVNFSGNIDVDGTANLDVVDIDGALTQDGGAVFNEESADVDFRIESDSQGHAFFLEGSTSLVGIGVSNPADYNSYGNGLVIDRSEQSNSSGITLVSGTSGYGSIYFSDATGNVTHGAIEYGHGADLLKIKTGGAESILVDASGNVKFPQLQNLELTALNKAPHIKTTDQLTQLADDAFVTVSNASEPLQGLLIVTNYNLGHTGIFRHDYASSTTTLISGNSGGFATSDSDGYLCVYTAVNAYDVYIKNRQGSARDIKILLLGTYQ